MGKVGSVATKNRKRTDKLLADFHPEVKGEGSGDHFWGGFCLC